MKLHLCCGPQKIAGWVNVDRFDFGQEVVADIEKEWNFCAENEVDAILCKDGFEHVISVGHFLSEAARVLKPGGTLTIWVPHFKNPSAYRVTHRTLLSWSYFDVFPEPHDVVKNLEVISNKIYIGRKYNILWKIPHIIINTIPKWWERLFYVSNIEVVFRKIG